MDRLCTFTRDLVRNKHKLLPLLLFSSFALMLICPCSSSYAETGYNTRVRADFDGFIEGDLTGNNAANLITFGLKRNNNFNYVGYFGNYPYLCYPYNGNPLQNCLNTGLSGGRNAKGFEQSYVKTQTLIGSGYDYQANVEYYRQWSFTVPSEWFGNHVVVSWDLDIGSYEASGGSYLQSDHSAVELNWGAVTVRMSGVTGVCDVPFAKVNSEVQNNDFISFDFDFTGVTSSDCSQWDWYLTSNGSGQVPTNGYKFLLANFHKTYNIYYMSPYIAYDIVPPEAGGDLEEIIDDWKTQQEQEFEAIENAATAAGSAASPIMSVFNFTVINPMSSLWSLFIDNSCVNIPIIASMIHYTQSNQVCTWWSASTRSVTTPVFVTLGTLLLWGFVMSWLRNDGAMLEIGEESDPMSPYVGGIRSKVGFKKKG